MMTVFDELPVKFKSLAYGNKMATPTNKHVNAKPTGETFRLERGAPFLRAGKLVTATPQFRSQTLYSISAKVAGLPTATQTPVAISRPYRTK